MIDVAGIREFLSGERQRARVLIVDDEPAICAALAMAMDDCGLQSVTAGSAEEALEYLENESFQLLVSDKNLPQMSGLDLFARSIEIAPELAMVMMTGYASIDTVKEAISIGAIDYIAKPFDDVFAVATKLAKIVERRIHLATYEQIAGALLAEVRQQGDNSELSRLIGPKLGHFKVLLAKAPDIIVFDEEKAGRAMAAAFKVAGLDALTGTNPQQVLQHLAENPTISIAVVALDQPSSMELLEAINEKRFINVVLSSTAPELRTTLSAIALGASDLYLRDIEEPATLAARLRHTIASVQREQLFTQLFATLHVYSDLVDDDLIDLIAELAPDCSAFGRDESESESESESETGDASALLQELSPKENTITAVPRILIVDDEPTIRKAISMMLEEREWNVTTAENGVSAVHAATQEPFDVLILDKNLPDISGVEVLKRIREHDTHVRAIMLTGYANVESAVEMATLGVDAFYEKPLHDIYELGREVAASLQNKKRAEELAADARSQSECV
jgi:DNA-binding NtrC family response regulator